MTKVIHQISVQKQGTDGLSNGRVPPISQCKKYNDGVVCSSKEAVIMKLHN